MSIELRPFCLDDYRSAFALWQAAEGVGLSEADSLPNIARFLERNPRLSFVALAEQSLVGTVLCGHDGRRGLIHHLAVTPTARRRGIGRALVAEALAALRRSGIDKCHLLVFHENVAGREFWRRIGAEERTTLGVFSLRT